MQLSVLMTVICQFTYFVHELCCGLPLQSVF